MNRPIFEYTPLSGRGDTRILCLEPGDQHDDLQGTLEPMRIDSLQKTYDAISYCWGDSKDLTSIVCNGCDLTITKSSAEVLRRVRLLSKPRHVWIDRICINQNDIPERTQQVSIMKRIYEGASKTLIWLGGEANNSNGALKLICELAEVAKSRHKDPEVFRRGKQNVFNMSRLKDWEALDALMNRPWWARVWMVQEVSVSISPIAMCGTATIDWRLFSPALSVPRSSSIERTLFWEEAQRTRAQYMKYTLIGSFPDRGEIDIPFRDLLAESRSKYATDPRDKVFALFGLATDTREDSPQPDYSKTIEFVYKEATKDVILRDSTLTVIEYAGLNKSVLKVPSWCVDWSFGEGDDSNSPVPLRTLSWLVTNFNKSPSDVTSQYGHNFSASGSIKMEATFSENMSTLKVRGVRVGRVAHLGMGFSREIIAQAIDEFSTFGARCKSPYFTGEEIEVVISQTSHGGFWYDSGGKESDERHLKSVQLSAWEARRSCVTDTGFAGLVPIDAEVSDMIYMIAGCEVPFILRRFDTHLAAIGQCYVHGAMHGEMLRNVETKGRGWEDIHLQ